MTSDVFQHHDGVIDHEAGRDRQGHQRQVVEGESEQIHHPQGAEQGDGHRDRRHQGRRPRAQEQRHYRDHQDDGDQQVALHVGKGGADGCRPVDHGVHLDVRRQGGGDLGQDHLDRIDGVDDVRPRLGGDLDHHRRLALGRLALRPRRVVGVAEEAQVVDVLDPIHHIGDILQPHRRAVAVGDHQGLVVDRLGGGVIGVELQPVLAVGDDALGPIGVGRGQGRADVFQPDAIVRQLVGIELDPHRGQGRAADADVADALHLRQPLLDDIGDGVVDLPRRAGLRRQGQDEDRRGRGVGLAIDGVAAQGHRQVGAGGVDRRLHVAGRAVHVPVDAELQHHRGLVQPALRGHLVHIGDVAKPSLQRRGHAGGHGLRAGAGQVGLDEDHRQVRLRHRCDRQQEIGPEPRHGDPDRHEGGADRPSDEDFGEVHA